MLAEPSWLTDNTHVILLVVIRSPCSLLPTKETWSDGIMKLYSLSVIYKGSTKPNLLKAAFDLSSFNFFQRSRCLSVIQDMLWLQFISFVNSIYSYPCVIFVYSFNVFSRSNLCYLCVFSIQEFMTFTSSLIVERTSQGTRASVKEQGRTGRMESNDFVLICNRWYFWNNIVWFGCAAMKCLLQHAKVFDNTAYS